MGRTKEYNEQEVLEKAMKCFWKHGYEHASMRKLEEAMGINQFSIYSSFKNKAELYRRSLICYTEYLEAAFLKDLQKKHADIETIRSVLMKFSNSVCHSMVPNGCMMVGSVPFIENLDKDTQEIIHGFFRTMKMLFEEALANSHRLGKIPESTDMHLTAEYLVGIAQSMSIYSKMKTEEEIKKYLDFAINQITLERFNTSSSNGEKINHSL